MIENRNLPDFSENLEWNLVIREAFTAVPTGEKGYIPIPNRTVLITDSFALMVGVRVDKAEPNWFLGCWAEQRLAFTPSSTSQFTASVKTKQVPCQMGGLTLCIFPKLQSPWLLNLRFPWWIDNAFVEVWRYDGADQTVFEALASTHP